MADNLVYMYGKLCKAIEILITNRHDVRNRVWVAANELSLIQADGLPPSLRADITWIHEMMNRYPADALRKSSLDATYHRTRNSTAEKIARRIWTLFHLMQSELEARQQWAADLRGTKRESPLVIVHDDLEVTRRRKPKRT